MKHYVACLLPSSLPLAPTHLPVTQGSPGWFSLASSIMPTLSDLRVFELTVPLPEMLYPHLHITDYFVIQGST